MKRLLGSWIGFLGGLGAGAGAAYYLDPDRGRARRVQLRDRSKRALRDQGRLADKGARDLEHRAAGLVARTRASWRREQVSDDQLVQRVRSVMGHHVTHPGSIDVVARDGHVTLSGPVFRGEVERLVRRVSRVPGVVGVETHLEQHDSDENVPGLQGRGRVVPRPLLLRDSWPPWLRLVSAATGLTVGGLGMRRGGIFGGALAAAGSAALVRGMSNVPLREIVTRRRVMVQKTLEISAPIEEVFSFWAHFSNFPRFMRHVESIHTVDGGHRSHWRVHGPAGSTLSWEAERTAYVSNKIISWRTRPGSVIEHAGTVHFEPVGDSSTRLHVQMSYEQPAGVIGLAAARLFRSDPKHAFDEDLIRLKTLLEEGKTRDGRGDIVRAEDLH